MKKCFIALISLLLTFSLCGCKTNTPPGDAAEESPAQSSAQTDATKPDGTPTVFGEVKDGRYINSLLGITADIPEGWSVDTEEELLASIGLETDAGDDLSFETMFEHSSIIMLFQCTKDDSGSQPKSVINISIDNTALTPEYIDKAVLSVQSSLIHFDGAFGLTASVSKGGSVDLDYVKYETIHAEIVTFYGLMYQDQFITGINGKVLIISCGYSNSDKDAVIDSFSSFLGSMEYN